VRPVGSEAGAAGRKEEAESLTNMEEICSLEKERNTSLIREVAAWMW